MLNTKILFKVAGIGLATSVAFLGTANKARALDFSFSFDDTAAPNQGTVTGTISGLSDNATDQKTATVSIDSAPASLGFSSLPLTFNNASGSGFDVSSGAIQNTSSIAYNTTGAVVRFNVGAQGLNTLTNTSNRQSSFGANGFSGVTYAAINTSTPTPVPFGAAPNTGIVILSGMYGASRLRKKLAANK